MNTNIIDWDAFKMQQKYFKLEIGEQDEIVITNWRQESKTFQDNENERLSLVFDVIKIGSIECVKNPLEYSTTSFKLIETFHKAINDAESKGKTALLVWIKREAENKYIVIDFTHKLP